MRLAVLVALAVSAVALPGCLGNGAPPDGGPPTTADGSWDLTFFGVDDDPFLGDASAPVQVVAYDAPGCPSCKRYHDTVYPGIEGSYIATGRIGYHYVQWTVGYGYDTDGGIAEECAYREGGSEVYVDAVARVFANQGAGFSRSDNLPDILRGLAADHGLDEDALLSCYEGDETEDEVEADIAAGRASGAGSNPGFAVLGPNGFYEYVKSASGPGDAIERALAA